MLPLAFLKIDQARFSHLHLDLYLFKGVMHGGNQHVVIQHVGEAGGEAYEPAGIARLNRLDVIAFAIPHVVINNRADEPDFRVFEVCEKLRANEIRAVGVVNAVVHQGCRSASVFRNRGGVRIAFINIIPRDRFAIPEEQDVPDFL